MPRDVRHRYVDPLAEIWLRCAAKIGLSVQRGREVYAATDGAGTLTLGEDDTLDADDSLAQMIFHELCHSLVEGPESFGRPDWGLDNQTARDEWREHATLRVQAVLSRRHGLGGLFAPTTDFRAYWDALPADVLGQRDSVVVQRAISALRWSEQKPWAPWLGEALAATGAVAQVVRGVERNRQATGTRPPAMGSAQGRGAGEAPSLWEAIPAPPPQHPTGLPVGIEGQTCGTCAWRTAHGKCRQAEQVVKGEWAGCERWEAGLDCLTCGACCRAAYHCVQVGKRDPVIKRQPDYVVAQGGQLELKRAGDRCAALAGGEERQGRVGGYHCVIYDDRPRTCREFTLGSAHCLTARRRVGLSL